MNKALFDYLDSHCDRSGTDCVKWDCMPESDEPLIPMWVADMDFPTAPAIAKAIQERAAHPVYGYTCYPDIAKAEAGWLKRRHGLDVCEDWILSSPGVVDSLFLCVRALTNDGDKVMIFTPVYGPFYSAVETFDRVLVKSALIDGGEGDWRIDFDDVEKQFADGVKLFLLCNPHNPVGRLWSREELTRLTALANRYGVRIVSDEIHAEFAFDGRKTARILSIPGSERFVMLTSASKAFNIAGLRQSSIIVADEEAREAIKHEFSMTHACNPNLFGAVAQTAAYNSGDEWMDAVVEYIQGNRDFAVQYIREHIPEIKCYPQQGTYLMWLDCSGCGIAFDDLKKLFIEKAHVFMNEGTFFGEAGEYHFRFNIATQRAHVAEALSRMERALHG